MTSGFLVISAIKEAAIVQKSVIKVVAQVIAVPKTSLKNWPS